MATTKRKLIEVAPPLEAIDRESACEKSIGDGHPSTKLASGIGPGQTDLGLGG